MNRNPKATHKKMVSCSAPIAQDRILEGESAAVKENPSCLTNWSGEVFSILLGLSRTVRLSGSLVHQWSIGLGRGNCRDTPIERQQIDLFKIRFGFGIN